MKIEVGLNEALRNSSAVLMTEAIKLPDYVRDQIADIQAVPSPVDRIKKLGECLYACKGELTDPLREVVAHSFNLREEFGWLPEKEPNRAKEAIQAMRRDMGEDGTWPKEADDPVSLIEFADPAIEAEAKAEAEKAADPKQAEEKTKEA